MTMKYLIFAILSFFTLSVSSSPYVGVSQSKIAFDTDDIGDFDFKTRSLIIGTEINNTADIELRYGTGIDDDSLYGIDIDVDKTVSIFGKLKMVNETALEPYLLLGYTKATLEAGGDDDSDDGMSYGAGVGFELTDALMISAEYIVLLDDSDYDFTSTGVSLTYRF